MRTSTANACHLLQSGALLLVVILNSNAAYPLEVMVKIPEGAACDVRHERAIGTGTCVVVTQCPPAVKSLKAIRSHDLARCGFRGTLEIVCCPTDALQGDGKEAPTTSSTTAASVTSQAVVRTPAIRKSARACEELVDRFDVPKVSYQISGGENAEPGEFPHMVALGYESDDEAKIDYRCGGTLISERFVLTAAHCIISQSGAAPVRCRMGMIDITGTDGLEVGVRNITIHQEYQRKKRRNDIAVIELDRAVAFTNNIHPACLYTKADDPQGLVITGWGDLENAGNRSAILQKGLVTPVDVAKCNATYAKNGQLSAVIEKNQLCAIAEMGNTDACQGDSGGPIQTVGPSGNVYYVIGVTSFGRFCGGTYPGVYSRVHSYLDWIEKIVWLK